MKGEFIHYDLGTSNYLLLCNPGIGLGGTSFNDRVHVDGNIVRAGVNYKFGDWAPVPVVARY